MAEQSVKDRVYAAAATTEAREQLTVAARKHADEIAEFKSQLAEERATVTTLQQTQDALIARIQPNKDAPPAGKGKNPK